MGSRRNALLLCPEKVALQVAHQALVVDNGEGSVDF